MVWYVIVRYLAITSWGNYDIKSRFTRVVGAQTNKTWADKSRLFAHSDVLDSLWKLGAAFRATRCWFASSRVAALLTQ